MVKLAGGAILFVAIIVLLGALLAGAVEYWPVTLIAIAGIVGVFVLRGKMRERRNRV